MLWEFWGRHLRKNICCNGHRERKKPELKAGEKSPELVLKGSRRRRRRKRSRCRSRRKRRHRRRGRGLE